MNIVKIKDDVEAGDLKNLYCYNVNCMWVAPFDSMSKDQYVYCSQHHWMDPATGYKNYSDLYNAGLIDVDATNEANSIVKWVEYNKFVPQDEELTMEQIKKFRTWLATVIIDMKGEQLTDFEILEMLKYYKGEMSNDTVKHLEHFAKSETQIVTGTTAVSCSCHSLASSESLSSVSTCDALAIYRKGIYNKMVEVFSEVDYWMDMDKEFLSEFKRYIDAIIQANLPLTSSPYVSELYDCGCLSNAEGAQERLMQILKNLSTSLQYMINSKDASYEGSETLEGHKNFVGDTFLQWYSKLYEVMRW